LKQYLFHIPHSSTFIPNEFKSDYLISNEELQNNIFEYADLFTDELFEISNQYNSMINPYSRLFFDPERFGDDNIEPMQEKYGLGWFYENCILENKPLRNKTTKNEIRKFFDEYHKKLNQLTSNILKVHKEVTVVDCHSYSDREYWFLKDIKRPDICIGFESFHADLDLVKRIQEEFSNYSIGINNPYAGSLVPTNYWQKESRVKSVMIEINKRLYLEEDNITKNSNFNNLKSQLNNIFKK